MSEVSLEQTTTISPALRAKVGEWLSGIHAVQEGLFEVFFIETNDGPIKVNRSNSVEIEFNIYDAFEAHIKRGEN